MTTNIQNRSPYLRTSREFPTDSQALSVEMGKTYIDIANVVNARTIGDYASAPTITGNTWFSDGQKKRQTLRKTFEFTSTANIPHAIANVTPGQFIGCYGSYTDGTNSYGLLFGTSVAVAGLISFYINSTDIVFLTGAGAPALSSGKIVLEYLS